MHLLTKQLVNLKSKIFDHYQKLPENYDEYFNERGQPHSKLKEIVNFFSEISLEEFLSLHDQSQNIFCSKCISFNNHSSDNETDKIFPVDLLPRVIQYDDWQVVEAGLKQRIEALNIFLNDIYSKQQIIKDNPLIRQTVHTCKDFYPQLVGTKPPNGVYIHVAGIDLIRDKQHQFKVLEDNLRVPSGVSYAIESRNLMKWIFPKIFSKIHVESVTTYPFQLREALHSIAAPSPTMVLLTPGPYNSAYFEHAYLSRRMDCPLVQNTDLVVENDKVYLKTIGGLKQVHIIYRRTNDEFIDPKFFNPKSLLGVPGLVKAYLAGNVILANALGNGVADDKAIYPYIPDIIRYYLDQEPILPQVVTYSGINPKDHSYILNNLSSLIIKPVNESGGKGILFGKGASKSRLKEIEKQFVANPRNYIAQPIEELSVCPTLTNGVIHPRRIDLRPFIVTGKTTWVMPGGLTRTAVDKDSYIVNSSQGGGTKDTWILSC